MSFIKYNYINLKQFSGNFFNDATRNRLGGHSLLESRRRDVPNNGFF